MEQRQSWSTFDGLRIQVRLWYPDSGRLRGTVYLVHGLGEHSGRWGHVGERLASADYAMLAADLRGHGLSEGPRGHAPSLEALLDDVDIGLEQANKWGGERLFLAGHSLGGTVVVNHALRRRPSVTGVVSSAPWLELAMPEPGWKTALGRLLTRIAPKFAMPNGLDQQALSHDEEVVRAYAEDPLVHDRISAALGICLVDASRWALEHALELHVPMLMMHGTGDRITSWTASRRFAQQAGALCTYRAWDGLYHEIHNEPEGTRVVATVIDWLNERTQN